MNLIGGLDDIVHRRALKRWSKISSRLETLDMFSLATLREQANDLRLCLDRVVSHADLRLSNPTTGASDPSGPGHADWVWRPDIFRLRQSPPGRAGVGTGVVVGSGVQVFHDCRQAEVTVKQRPGHGRVGAAPRVLDIDVLSFEGEFLSFVIDLPIVAVEGLGQSHIVQVDTMLEIERPMDVFLRLNVKHGPNTEQLVREVDTRARAAATEFDLAYAGLGAARIERAWLEIILEKPAMNRVVLEDFVCSRRLRAEV